MPEVLWSFTEEVIKNIKLLGVSPPRVDAHDKGDNEGSDFISGKTAETDQVAFECQYG